MSAEVRTKILVVDDNPATLYTTGRVLKNEGFEVLKASTGREAVSLASRISPDLIVLDVNLPDINGFEVCREVRSNPLTQRTPIVHLSATFVKDEYKVEGFEAGADAYLTHPVDPPVLVANVKAFLRRQRAEEILRKSEAKFKTVFEQAPNPICLLTPQMHLAEVNPAMCLLLDRSCEDITGKPLENYMPEDLKAQIPHIIEAMKHRGTWRGVLSLLHPYGQRIEVDWNMVASAPIGAWLANVTDITRRSHLEVLRDPILVNKRSPNGK
jgi:PAS domain S-box-containing protein